MGGRGGTVTDFTPVTNLTSALTTPRSGGTRRGDHPQNQTIEAMWALAHRSGQPRAIDLPSGSGIYSAQLALGANIPRLRSGVASLVEKVRKLGLNSFTVEQLLRQWSQKRPGSRGPGSLANRWTRLKGLTSRQRPYLVDRCHALGRTRKTEVFYQPSGVIRTDPA